MEPHFEGGRNFGRGTYRSGHFQNGTIFSLRGFWSKEWLNLAWYFEGGIEGVNRGPTQKKPPRETGPASLKPNPMLFYFEDLTGTRSWLKKPDAFLFRRANLDSHLIKKTTMFFVAFLDSHIHPRGITSPLLGNLEKEKCTIKDFVWVPKTFLSRKESSSFKNFHHIGWSLSFFPNIYNVQKPY